jgi:hypothetical protein
MKSAWDERIARVKAVPIGGSLRSYYLVANSHGLLFPGETVEVIYKTRSTVHVKSARGITHIRYYYYFDADPIAPESETFTSEE